MQIFGADGIEITSDPADHSSKRASLSIVTKFWKVIKKFGSRVVTYLTCVGAKTALHCADDVSFFFPLLTNKTECQIPSASRP